MPFVPLTPEELEKYKPPCTNLQHYPPTMMVVTFPMKWKCPSCGHETMLFPSTFVWGGFNRVETKMQFDVIGSARPTSGEFTYASLR